MRQALFVTVLTGALAAASVAAAQTPPPAPALVEPASGASRVQPITLRWNPVVDPDGPIGSYTWQVGTSSSFTTIVLSGFTQQSLPGIPVPTEDKVSGLPLGTYFWRVRASQTVGGAIGSIDSAWSAVRSFTVSTLGAEPGTPSFTAPATGTRFHAAEFFTLKWSAVADAQYYLLEADDEPSFSYPLTLNTDVMQFGTKYRAGWGNEIPNVYYRVRAVSADGVRGLPSPTLNVKITNTAPVPPAPTPLSPNGGATVSIPFTFDWTDTPNPQDAGYDLDVDDEPNFLGDFGVLLVQNVSRSDYMLTETLAPGTYFWRVRAVHGQVRGPWSAGASFRIVAGTTGVTVLSIVAAPSAVSGGNSTQARVTLSAPAPAGGVVVKVASDFSQAQTPASVTIPAGATDATISPITTVPVPGATVGTIRAAVGLSWQMSSLGLFPLLYGLELSDESVIGGDTLTGTVTLLNPAPAGGIEVTLVSGNTSLIALPAKVVIPAGSFGATFNIATSPVSVPTRVILDSGTAFETYRAPSNWLTLMPPGSPSPAPSLSAVTVASASVAGGAQTTGTVTLTGPAPAGGALVRLNGSMEGTVVTPANVLVPAGSVSANFSITAPQVPAPHYVLIQASYSSFGAGHARLIAIVPGSGSATLQGFSVSPTSVVGGVSTTGFVQLVVPAPAGGGIVSLTSGNPALVQVPATVSVPAGNSATSFPITTSATATFTTVQIDASAGGVTRSEFINLAADPNNPPAGLQSLTLGASSVTGGTTVTGTVVLSGNAPSGGVSVTLATSNSSTAQVPPIVMVPAGQSQATFAVTTFAVSTNRVVTITGFQGSVTLSASLTVLSGSAVPTPGTPSLVSPADAATVTQLVALDWSDASNAANYEIQVDDSSAFSAPLVSSLTSTASQTSVSGLAAVQHWWRVRAKNSAGVAGNWSAARRFTVGGGSPPPASLAIALSGVPATISRGQSFTATATVNNTGGGAASGLTVVVSVTPSDAVRLRNPQNSTQSVATVAAGGSRSVAWEIRAERAGTATVTMTLRNSSGTTVGTATRTLTIN